MKERCAVFGAAVNNNTAAQHTYYGLFALQHRGQDASGIVTEKQGELVKHGGYGLVSQVYTLDAVQSLESNLALGHNLYTTSTGGGLPVIQPLVSPENNIALAFNGNIPDLSLLKKYLTERDIPIDRKNDTELMFAALCWLLEETGDVYKALAECWELWNGAFSVALLTPEAVIGYRGPFGVRPLMLGTSPDGGFIASESCAFDSQVSSVRSVNPGEIVTVFPDGRCVSQQVAESPEALDSFEIVYFARPDSELLGQSVYAMRRRMGQQFAREHQLPIDMVVPVPDSALPAAEGFSEVSGVPLQQILIKNRYVHRTFIQPSPEQRAEALRHKLSLIKSEVRGKRVLIFDDSIVRGTTAGPLVKLFIDAGAREVYFGSASPPVLYPDFYGIATPSQNELIAAQYTPDQIAHKIGANGVYFLSYQGLLTALQVDESRLNTSCFTGVYPIDIGQNKSSFKKV